jgi:hypothetical protein
MGLREKLYNDKFTLIVSIPRNDKALALAAIEGGADAIKVHTNVFHRASGNFFPDFMDQIDTLRDIVSSVDIPVGIVPGGGERCIQKGELAVLKELHFDFISMFAQDMPLYLYNSDFTIMCAVTDNFSLEELKAVNKSKVDIVEADVLPDDKREKLYFSDLVKYERMLQTIHKPVVIPTQRAIEPDEVQTLFEMGAKGLMIGAIVTGSEPKSLREITLKYRMEIDRLIK